MVKLAVGLLVCLLPLTAEATVVATVLTSGSAIDVASATTASVSPTSGALVILVQTTRKDVCVTPTVTGLGTTWTVRDSQSIISNVFVQSLWTTTSNGTAGTIVLGYTGKCSNIAYEVVQFTGVNTATNDGYVVSSHTNSTGCSPCSLNANFPAYAAPNNLQISSCMSNFGPGTFTKDPDPGWAAGTTVNTANSAAGDILTLGVQWLIVRGSDTSSDCVMSPAGAANSMIFTSEFTASVGSARHRVTQ